MSETDNVVSSLKVKQAAIFNLNDIYKIMKKWFSDNGYSVAEKEYNDSNKKSIKIKWGCMKRVDDYSQFSIDVSLKAKVDENVVIRGKKLQKGEVEFELNSSIMSDYGDYWEGKATSKMLRGIYDKYVQKDKKDKYNDELKEDTYAAYNELKSYLGLHILK